MFLDGVTYNRYFCTISENRPISRIGTATATTPGSTASRGNTTLRTTHDFLIRGTRIPETCPSTTVTGIASRLIGTTRSTATMNGFQTASGIEFGTPTMIPAGTLTILPSPVFWVNIIFQPTTSGGEDTDFTNFIYFSWGKKLPY